ncbi:MULTISPECIES: MurR/RpiR family transcriptional regulator [unclassified Rhizobium]|uniref:MurR/RpiR family transcriptional regulator n=1 Tax=unclassified Rhizobium TaxID=2613769 RepID=UPI000271B229|nr:MULTISPECIES: MurR/RpiR family transcriptional regulator [unclassified Rhizobium]EJL50543.1 transcriptional regulator [Rhizobium sp. CF122]MBB3396979.1 DNA-binding MurR/RpiR family transcriptional regulator [Rhizobium sp. BK060]MBB4171864.1 DNA-binding MurR/RpiR family transcriptional regulator [Rhizobium sp. BK538]TCM75936.1 RpiR family transcriptional regulator [Rhizobium sp. BK068]
MPQERNHHPPATLQELKYLIAKRQIVFPNSLEQVARQIIERPEMIAFESAAAIARNCKVSQTTVHRFAQHIGFQTLGEFRAVIRDHLRKTAANRR